MSLSRTLAQSGQSPRFVLAWGEKPAEPRGPAHPGAMLPQQKQRPLIPVSLSWELVSSLVLSCSLAFTPRTAFLSRVCSGHGCDF